MSRYRRKPLPERKPCAHCQTQFQPLRPRGIYCSDKCRVAAFNLTKKPQPIATAPKDRTILLFFPEFSVFCAAWWFGSWSYSAHQWVISTPMVFQGKGVVVDGLPQPTHWLEGVGRV